MGREAGLMYLSKIMEIKCEVDVHPHP